MNSPRPPISIVLADDHPVVLHGTASILRAQPDINVVALYPWLMLSVVPVFIIVLAFNFFGDGLRDAADPYGR